LKLEGSTDWQTYGVAPDTFLVSDLIMTLQSEKDAWVATDKPEWFIAFPSTADNVDGTRDYIIIKGSYEWVEEGGAAASTGSSVDGGAANDPSSAAPAAVKKYLENQTIEFYQSQNPSFEAVLGKFNFIDNGGIYSK